MQPANENIPPALRLVQFNDNIPLRLGDAFKRGGYARHIGNAFISNPYAYDTPQWQQWREGWMAQDLIEPDFHRVPALNA